MMYRIPHILNRTTGFLLLMAAYMIIPVIISAHAEGNSSQAERIAAIEVTGNQHIEDATVLDKMHTQVGDVLNRKTISRDVKRLFATGFFSDIRVIGDQAVDGKHLTIQVKENPMIATLTLEGNHEVATKDLKLRLKLKSGNIFNPVLLRKDTTTIRKGYLKKGYYQVNVEIIKKPLRDGRIDVTMHVHEGTVTRIKRIHFIGNHAFSEKELSGKIASRHSDLIAWFSDRDIFNKDRIKADGQLLLQTYLNHGYLDAHVESTLVSLSADKKWFYLTFSIHEGPQYHVASIALQGDIVPDEATLKAFLTLHSGDLYSLEKLRNSVDDITTRVGDEGYAFANVSPMFHRHPNERKVDITLDIEKGRRVYVERIDITGNEKTVDSVARREMRQSEGTRFSSSNLKLSKERLKKLGLFKDVRVSMPRGQAADKVQMKVDLTEKRTGSFSVGAGFSQLQKVFVRTSISENNFLGKGYQTNLSGEVGAKVQNFNVSFTNPYFMDENFSLSTNAFKRQTRLQTVTGFKEDSFGGGLGVGVPITEHLSYSVGYQFTDTQLFDIPTTSSLALRSQEGTQTTGEITQVLAWDTRDQPITPNKGYLLSSSVGVAGFGGRNRFVEFSGRGAAYIPISFVDGMTLNPSMTARYIHGFSQQTVPIFRRFSLGGIGTLRGFDQFGVTIRDPATNDVLGGNKMATASMNLFFPFPYMHTSGFRGVLFADAGTIADRSTALQFSTLRTSVGFGIEWISPIGPVGLVWGFPLKTQTGDIEKSFEFALGGGF